MNFLHSLLLTLIEGFGYFRITMGEQAHMRIVAEFFKKKFLEVLGVTQISEN